MGLIKKISNKIKERQRKTEIKKLVHKEHVDFLVNCLEPLQIEASELNTGDPRDEYCPEMFRFFENLYKPKISILTKVFNKLQYLFLKNKE